MHKYVDGVTNNNKYLKKIQRNRERLWYIKSFVNERQFGINNGKSLRLYVRVERDLLDKIICKQ